MGKRRNMGMGEIDHRKKNGRTEDRSEGEGKAREGMIRGEERTGRKEERRIVEE